MTEALDVEPLWHWGFYDGAIDGVVLFHGEMCWFRWNENLTSQAAGAVGPTKRVYEVFAMTDAELREVVTQHIKFERYVGCGSCYHVTADGGRDPSLTWWRKFGNLPDDNPFYKGWSTQKPFPPIIRTEGRAPVGTFTSAAFPPVHRLPATPVDNEPSA